jgi:hypothetical protein
MRVEHERRRLPVKTAALSLLLAGGLVLALAPRLGTGALALALVLGAALALALTPALVWLMLPALGSVMRLGAPLALLALASAVSATLGRGARQVVASGAALVVAFVFGAWVRWWFLPSAGSWDTEYWKAWTERAATHGLTRVYGDPEPFEPRRFLAQLRGREPLWRVDFHGQLLAVD